jgi:hypothetical protein
VGVQAATVATQLQVTKEYRSLRKGNNYRYEAYMVHVYMYSIQILFSTVCMHMHFVQLYQGTYNRVPGTVIYWKQTATVVLYLFGITTVGNELNDDSVLLPGTMVHVL